MATLASLVVKRINAFTHSLAQANEQYVFQTELIGANARAQEIANVKRKNFFAVEQQIWEAEQSGTQLSIATQQRLRDEVVKSTVTIIKAIDARWEAERAWETGVAKALNSYIESVTNAAAQAERLFTNAFKGMEDALMRFVQTGIPNGQSPATSATTSSSAAPQAPININFSVRAMDARSFQSAMVQNKAVVVGIVNQALNMRGRHGITA